MECEAQAKSESRLRRRKNKAVEEVRKKSTQQRFTAGELIRVVPVWQRQFSFPFDYALSKNAVWRIGRGGHVFSRRETMQMREAITQQISLEIQNAGIRVSQNKLWIEMLVEKPDARGDAINIVDVVCDAVKDAVGLDDRWFCLSGLDWRIVKEDPQIHLTLCQESFEDVQPCGYCGFLLPFEAFTKNRSRESGIHRICRSCTRTEDSMRRAESHAIA